MDPCAVGLSFLTELKRKKKPTEVHRTPRFRNRTLYTSISGAFYAIICLYSLRVIYQYMYLYKYSVVVQWNITRGEILTKAGDQYCLLSFSSNRFFTSGHSEGRIENITVDRI